MVDVDRVVAALPAYEIGSELGRGAYGVVLAGRHRQLGRLVAIKQLPVAFVADPAVRTRFIAEARVLATLDHPHIVAIYDFVDYEGLCLLVMERLTGGTVWSRFHAGGFTPDVSCAILLAVCAGLHHAHQHGVLHRDIKPENLMFSGEGTLKVTDLGIAKVVGGSSTLATRAGDILGTPAYIAPEQARGAQLTPATDVYQAGTLLYELLAGRLPYPADSDAATTLYRHVHEAPPPLLEVAHHVPAQLAAVTDRSISTSPEDRYQSAEEFGIAIAHCAAQTWGRGWLARTNVPVSASGPILSAALGELTPATNPATPPTVKAAPRANVREPVPGEFLPVQEVHPELRDDVSVEPDGAAGDGRAPGEVEHSTGRGFPSGEVAVASAAAVDRGAQDAPVGAASPPGSPRANARRRPTRWIIAGLAAVVAGAAVAVVIVATTTGGGSRHGGAAAPSPTVGRVVSASVWRVLPSAPTARQQMASTVSGGVLWFFGGLTNGVATTKVEGFDPAISAWQAGPDLPVKLHHDMAVLYHGEMVVMGGWIPRGSTLDAVTSNRVFALRKGEWVKLPAMHHARAAGAATVVGDKIVVSGGQANHQLVPATEVFDGVRWTDVAPIPTPRDHLAGATDGKYFYAVGGRDLSADKNIGAVERYDPATNVWARMSSLPTPRGGLGAVVSGNRLVTIGGESSTGVYGTVEVLDLRTNTWTTLPEMRTPRHGLAVLAVRNTIYTVNGAADAGHTDSVTNNEAIDLSSFVSASVWRVLPSAPTARQQMASTVSGGVLWFFGGLTNGVATTKVEGFDPAISAWQAGPDLPVKLHHDMAVLYHGEMVVMGGWIPRGSTLDAVTSNRVFALRKGEWVKLPAMHHARAAGAATVVGDKIVVSGGQANHQLVPATEVFDGVRWTDVAPIPTPRDHLAGATDGKYFYAVGGRDLSADKNIGAVERYDPATNVWARMSSLPTPRGGLGAVVSGNRLVTIGGESSTGVYGTVEVLDLRTNTWTTLPEMRTPRHGLAVLAVRNTIYTVNGAADAGHTDSVTNNEAIDLSCGSRAACPS